MHKQFQGILSSVIQLQTAFGVPSFLCDSKLFYFCVKKMEKIREEAFPPKDVFVQHKQETKFSLTCVSVDLSWDVAAVHMLFSSYFYPKQKKLLFQQRQSCKHFPSLFFFLILNFTFSFQKAYFLIYASNFLLALKTMSVIPLRKCPSACFLYRWQIGWRKQEHFHSFLKESVQCLLKIPMLLENQLFFSLKKIIRLLERTFQYFCPFFHHGKI